MNFRFRILVAAITISVGIELLADEGIETENTEVPTNQKLGSVHVSGMKGALDHLANQLISSSSQQNITILWLFDRSISVVPLLAETRRGLPRFNKKVAATARKKNGTLQMSAAAFGKEYNDLTNTHTTFLPTFLTAMRGITNDSSGRENVFQAILEVVQRNRVLDESHSVFLVIVTDEKGDDVDQLEAAIDACRKSNVTVYIIGKEAPFGQEYRSVPFYYSDGHIAKVFVSCGPESVQPERVPWPIWGSKESSSEILSNYGPYALVRLAEQTGGEFLILDDIKDEAVSAERLTIYKPESFSQEQYQAFVARNAARQALVDVAATDPSRMKSSNLTFSHQSTKAFQNELAGGLKYGAYLNQHSFQLLKKLRKGQADRGTLQEARWIAGYDLALGQVLAAQARLILYGDMLIEMQQSPKEFTRKESIGWALVPIAKSETAKPVEDIIAEAVQVLNSVIQQHPNTPWAEIAKRELQRGFGWRWIETQKK